MSSLSISPLVHWPRRHRPGIAVDAAVPGSKISVPHSTIWRRVGRALWCELEAIGHRRAGEELRLLADRWELTQPQLAAQLRRACERAPRVDEMQTRRQT